MARERDPHLDKWLDYTCNHHACTSGARNHGRWRAGTLRLLNRRRRRTDRHLLRRIELDEDPLPLEVALEKRPLRRLGSLRTADAGVLRSIKGALRAWRSECGRALRAGATPPDESELRLPVLSWYCQGLPI